MRSLAAVAVVSLTIVTPAFAGSGRTFVASTGDDLNPCSRTSPCRSFAAAIAVTNAGGEVVAIDSAGYGPVTISQSVTLVAPLGVHAGITATSGDGITVNAGSAGLVALRNLFINGQGGTNGITLNTAKALHIEQCVVNGFSTHNINLIPTTATFVDISDTRVSHAGASGIYVNGPGVVVFIDHSRMDLNGTDLLTSDSGVLADQATLIAISNSVAQGNVFGGVCAQGGTGAVTVTIESSVLSLNDRGIDVETSSRASVHHTRVDHNIVGGVIVSSGRLSLDDCVLAYNLGSGVDISGTAADADITACTITDNAASGVVQTTGAIVRLTRNTITRNVIGIRNTPCSPSCTTTSTGDNLLEFNGTNLSGSLTPANHQ